VEVNGSLGMFGFGTLVGCRPVVAEPLGTSGSI
jgi:hypothetical protein